MLRLALTPLVLALTLAACSKGDDNKGGGTSSADGRGGGGQIVDNACNNIVTQEALDSYNREQSDYRLEAYGANVHCEQATNVNGSESRVVVDGYTNANLLPSLFLVTASAPNVREISIKVRVETPTEAELNAVASRLKIGADQITVETNRSALYARFGKGALFDVGRFQLSSENKILFATFTLRANSNEEALLFRGMQEFLAKSDGLELFWSFRSGQAWRQVLGARTGWSNVDAVSVLKSFVREGDGPADRTRYTRAIGYVSGWDLDAANVHRELPELYRFAEDDWRTPSINDGSANDMLASLRYLVKVNPNHPRALVLSTYNRVSRFFSRDSESLRTALDYAENRGWNRDQFEQLVSLSEKVYDGFRSRSWAMATGIAQRTNFDSAKSAYFAGLAGKLAARRIIDQEPQRALEEMFAKIAAGLSPTNEDLYFRAFDYFVGQLRASNGDAEAAADKMVLGGRLSEGNFAPFVNFVGWLIDTAYIRFPEAIEVAAPMRSYDPDTLNLFKSAYNFLTDSVYMNRSEALKKSGTWLGSRSFAEESLRQLKAHYEWLVGTIYLNRSEALSRAENAVVTAGLAPVQLQSIRTLAEWMVNTVYLNRTESLTRAERLVLQAKLSADDVKLFQDSFDWLVNSLYVNRSEAANKVEGWVSGANRITRERFETLKGLTDWFINSIYLNRSEALNRGENLVVKGGLSVELTSVYRSCAEWMINSVYLNRSEAVTKTEGYVLTYKMTGLLFADLQREFDALVNQGKNRSEALRLAAQKVLKAN